MAPAPGNAPRPTPSRFGSLFTILLVLAMVLLIVNYFNYDAATAEARNFQNLRRLAYEGDVEAIKFIGDTRVEAKVHRAGVTEPETLGRAGARVRQDTAAGPRAARGARRERGHVARPAARAGATASGSSRATRSTSRRRASRACTWSSWTAASRAVQDPGRARGPGRHRLPAGALGRDEAGQPVPGGVVIIKPAPVGDPGRVTYEPATDIWSSLLLTFVPWLLICRLHLVLHLRQMRNGAAAAAGCWNFGRSRAQQITTKEHTNVTFDDVAGIEEAKEEVHGDRRVPQEPQEVPAPRRAHPARRAAGRRARHAARRCWPRPSPARPMCRSSRSRGSRLRRDVRRRRRQPRARPVQAGQGQLALHHLPG